MNQEIKALWVKALESGEYKQGFGAYKYTELGSESTFYCAMGVLMEVYARVSGTNFKEIIMEKEPIFQDWAGFGRGAYPYLKEFSKELNETLEIPITHLNDFNRFSFQHLAKLIKEQL